MRVVHLYPFEPRGRHGGTLRLAAAVEASAVVGDPEVHWFDPSAGAWRGPVDRSALERMLEPPESRPETGSSSDRPQPDAEIPAPASALRPSLKRRLFPSTLWESGLRARRAIRGHAGHLAIDSATVVYVHTTYLAGLLAALADGARASVVDVYDLVWRAHHNDARSAPPLTAALRGTYARAVRVREEALLRRADALVVAGYEDRTLLAARAPAARWVPTATPVEPLEPDPTADGTLRVGLLGNFAHISTRRSAQRVLRSPLADDPSTSVVLAGLHARAAIAPRPGVEVLGPVARAEDFYARIDCVVAPVELGSGIKCKLGEALLAGRPVVTTALGAAGFPPSLSDRFTVCDPGALSPEVVRRAVTEFEPGPAREDAERELGRDAVIARYAAALKDVVGRGPG